MKATILKDVVTLEMSREEAVALTMALKSTICQTMAAHDRLGELGSWDDLSAMGKVKDKLNRLLKARPRESDQC